MTRPIYVLVFQCSHVGIAMTSLLLHILRKIAPKTSSAFTSEEGRPSCIMHFQAFHQRIYTAARFSATLSSGFHTDCPDYATVGQKTISRQQGHNNGGRRQASALHPLRGAYFAIAWGEAVNIFLTSLYTYQLFSAVEHPPFGGFLQFCKVQAQGR